MILTPSSEFLNFNWLDESPPITEPSLSCRSQAENTGKIFRSRRSHTKSRNGCQNCKHRRIKCDETKPKCEQCIRHDIQCHYAPPKRLSESKKCQAITKVSSDTYDATLNWWFSNKPAEMSSRLVTDRIAEVLYPNARSSHANLVSTLQHFETSAYATLGSPAHQKVLQKHALSLSQGVPFLLHAIFAFSARHLQTLYPNEPKHAADATYHFSRAMHLYKDPVKATSAYEMDAFFASYMLLCALAFHHEIDQDRDIFDHTRAPVMDSSFLWSPETGHEWIDLVAFLGSLLRNGSLKEFARYSVWIPVLMDLDDMNNNFTDIRSGVVDLDPLFVSLCGITPQSNAVNNPYHAALRLLMPMMRVEPSIENFSKFITFPCRMRPSFIALYRAKDTVALLIMGTWFSIMSQIDHWWCKQRARTECWAICNHLDGIPDERINVLLQLLKERCGYVGIDMELIQTLVFGM